MDIYNTELFHHGIKGMKWGVRRAEKKAARQQKKRAKRIGKMQKMAQASAQSQATANEINRQGKAVADKYTRRGKNEYATAKRRAEKGKIIRAVGYNIAKQDSYNRASHARLMTNLDRMDWESYASSYNRKVDKLSKKWGISRGEAEVDRIMKSYADKPYDDIVRNYGSKVEAYVLQATREAYRDAYR